MPYYANKTRNVHQGINYYVIHEAEAIAGQNAEPYACAKCKPDKLA
jgi:hypothetical protein